MNTDLFKKFEAQKCNLEKVKGGAYVVDSCCTGEGATGGGGTTKDCVLCYDDGTWDIFYGDPFGC